MWKLIVLFSVLQLINVIMQTCKSIITVKGTRLQAALINAVAYMIYTVVVVYMVADFALWIKVVITGVTNFIGVYISNWILSKCRKDRLWYIVATIKIDYIDKLISTLNKADISYNYYWVKENEIVCNIFSKSQNESIEIKKVLNDIGAKYVVNEENVKL